VDEGSSAAFEVGGTNIVDGTYYWTIESNSEDFATSNGEFSITSNTGSFFVVPTTDDTTEGEQTFTVSIRSVSVTGTVLATSDPFTINDTSLDPITYEVTPAANNVDEGSSLEFTVSGTNITNGTYYWTIQDNISDFDTSSGEVTITDNAGSFTVTPSADATTEGSETFTVSLREGSIAGIILANSTSVTINDTSLDPVPPFSMAFTGAAGARRLAVGGNPSDWNLGTTWTLEWWSKTTTPAPAGSVRTIMSQEPSAGSIDVYYENGSLAMSNGTGLGAEPPVGGVPFGDVTKTTANQGWGEGQVGNNIPTTGGTGTGLTVDVSDSGSAYSGIGINTPGSGYTTGDVITVMGVDNSISDSFTITATARGIWTHVAISSDEGLVTVYYNGIEQNSVQRNISLTDASRDLYIGRRGNNDFQYFDGNLALIRISDTAKYATAFSPSISYGVDVNSGLFLGLTNPLVDTSYYELNGVSLSAQNSGQKYFSKLTLPFLDKQVQAGNTVTNTSDSTTSVVDGAVFTADPDNWGINVSPPMSFATTVNFSGARHTITNTGVVRTNDVPSFQSLQFVESENDYLEAAGSSDFNLGTTWTMEFWLNANAASTGAGGGIWGLLNQVGWSTTNSIVVALSDAKLVFLSVAANANADVRYTEPTPGQWTHVAIVNDEGTQTVWYNGVEQTKVSGTFGTASYTNGTDPLRIGRLGPANGGTLDGKMAMVRISNTAKYAAAFTHITTYGVEADTVLFLGKVNALNDSSSSDHNITNNGVATSTSFPQTLIGLIHPYGGGTFGTTYCLVDDPRLAEATAIPIGSRITSNIAGFGTRTVTGNQSDLNGGRTITYDNTGLTGNTSTSHVFNFYW
jgi:hypothetical protein